jgi:hypothetical protein
VAQLAEKLSHLKTELAFKKDEGYKFKLNIYKGFAKQGSNKGRDEDDDLEREADPFDFNDIESKRSNHSRVRKDSK